MTFRIRAGFTWLCVSLILAAVPAVSVADSPVELSIAPGASLPSVSVDSGGVAHFVWNETVSGGPLLLHYCQMAADGHICRAPQTFTPDGLTQANGVAQVLTPSPGRVLLIQPRCCNPQDLKGEDVLYESTDGGMTFTGPTTIGNISLYDAQFGPGSSSVSMVNDTNTNGTSFQTGPISGPQATTSALVGDGPNLQSYFGSIAFLNSTTPMVAFTDHSTVFTRTFDPTKGSDQNALANWKPTASVGPGDEPKLVTGPSGTFLLASTPSPGAHYVVRKLGADSATFGSPVDVSGTDSIFRDFSENTHGGLRAVWRESGMLRTRCSADGTTWTPTETVATDVGTTSYHNRLATGADGRGWVVSDSNDAGPIIAYPVAPCAGATSPGPGPGGTPTTPQGTSVPLSQVADAPSAKKCLSKHALKIRIRKPHGTKVKKATIFVNDKQVKTPNGKQLKAPVIIRTPPRGVLVLDIQVDLADGRMLTARRTYHVCVAGSHKQLPPSPCSTGCSARPRTLR